jgi:hypothetical protein
MRLAVLLARCPNPAVLAEIGDVLWSFPVEDLEVVSRQSMDPVPVSIGDDGVDSDEVDVDILTEARLLRREDGGVREEEQGEYPGTHTYILRPRTPGVDSER